MSTKNNRSEDFLDYLQLRMREQPFKITSFDDMMKTALPPKDGILPHVTGKYGEPRGKNKEGKHGC